MKTTRSLIVRSLIALIMPLAFSTCKKQDDTTGAAGKETFAQLAALSDAEADWVFDDIFNNVLGVNTEVGVGGLGIFGRANMSSGNRIAGVDSLACVLVNILQLNVAIRFPLQITIDFGSGCPGKDGRVRKGKIVVVYTGNISTAGNSATTAFDNYLVDNIKVEGSLEITNTSTLLKKSYTTRVTNARLTRPNGDFIQWNSEKNISQVEGMLTPIIGIDDGFNLTGQSNGSAQLEGKYAQWSAIVTKPLLKRFTCSWIVKGAISLQKEETAMAELDYGTGTCDRKASLTINGAAHEILLH